METLRRYASVSISEDTKYRFYSSSAIIVVFVELFLIVYHAAVLANSLKNHKDWVEPTVITCASIVFIIILILGLASPWVPNLFLTLHLFLYQMLTCVINGSFLVVMLVGLIFFREELMKAIEDYIKEEKSTQTATEFLLGWTGIMLVWFIYRTTASVVLYRFWRLRKGHQHRPEAYEPIDPNYSVY